MTGISDVPSGHCTCWGTDTLCAYCRSMPDRGDDMSDTWERRRPGELTPLYLGRVLDWIGGLGDMPRRAREGHFDDYFAPPEVASGMELHALIAELNLRARKLGPVQRRHIKVVVAAVKNGEFDATKQEAERWAASADGQAAFRSLLEGR